MSTGSGASLALGNPNPIADTSLWAVCGVALATYGENTAHSASTVPDAARRPAAEAPGTGA
ncbi:MAG: hypothetical protein ACLQRH_25605 [Acidimicrobiales bacterium]